MILEVNSEKEQIINVSVIIPTYNDWERLKWCLTALKEQSYPKHQFEVLVVNNDPSDPPPSWWEVQKGVRLLEEKKPGSYAARNLAIQNARGTVLAFTDADCLPEPDWLSEGMKVIENNGYSRVGGRINIFQTDKGNKFAFIYEKYFAFQQERNVKLFKKSVTGNFFAKKVLFLRYGFFDEKLQSGGDFFWNIKVSQAGENICYAKNAVVNHPARESISKIAEKKRRTIGGYYHESFSKLKLSRQMLILLKRTLPPISRIDYIKFDSLGDYLIVLLTRWYIELLGVAELLKLSWLKK
ncbi:Glycosyltransferase, GT2 family [Cyclobacterium lianum]|uniref:Glycosyltransferase, GT2 family n=1 Tax=Cyclobacterium lianum TaxID=388280 RepID=A0A1M7NDF0_9BACT|nr:glycosyltransferase [Cyclobacterium lianum]SHN01758.1 Glycosyltransferase, GT2 family [Cyclobacterium lianum]